ncbi:hypothetical protein ABIA31_005039 [Catenulispora sp. MAP5-51]|uniref:hypothetical protein n=1 Tax=Catenulispora sp. MAP5-51 TaxID=3156298 RepID=UPI003510D822
MNRIEKVATPIPAQPQLRLPRARRGTSGVAVAIAALAVPLLPGVAFGSTSAGGPGTATTEAPSQARHHLPPGQVPPGPGVVTVQGWTASGWTLTVPAWDGRHAPWLGDPGLPIDHPRPVILPDGKRGEIADYRVAPTGLRADGSGAPAAQISQNPGAQISGAQISGAQIPAGPADSTGPDGSTDSMPPGDASTEWRSGDPAASRSVRSRVLPEPLVPFAGPANTKQMVVPSRADADIPDGAMTPAPAVAPAPALAPAPAAAPAAGQASGQIADATAAGLPASSSCLSDGYPAGGDRFMAAHLRPVADPMDVVVAPHRKPCAVRVDYLSQARA